MEDRWEHRVGGSSLSKMCIEGMNTLEVSRLRMSVWTCTHSVVSRDLTGVVIIAFNSSTKVISR